MNKILLLIDEILKNCDNITNSVQAIKIDLVSIMECISSLATLSKHVAELKNDGLNIEELNEKLSSLLNALEEQDMELFSDNLQYELKPLLEYWKEVIVKEV